MTVSPASVAGGPTAYNCPESRSLTAVYTPRDAHVTADGKVFELRRVRDGGEARFENKAEKATLTLSRSQATWQLGNAPALVCSLRLRSLEPDALYGTGHSTAQQGDTSAKP
jgi:hypothetical protein